MGKAENVLRSIEKAAEKEFLPIIGPDKGQVLVDAVHENKPEKVLEVGTLIGYSAILMAKELSPEACLVTIEIDEDEAEVARANIAKAEVPPSVEVIVGDAVKVMPGLKNKFDLVFLDAEKTQYITYLRLVENKLCKGSVIIADNAGIFARQMKEYLDYVRHSGKYSSKTIPFGEDAVEISIKL